MYRVLDIVNQFLRLNCIPFQHPDNTCIILKPDDYEKPTLFRHIKGIFNNIDCGAENALISQEGMIHCPLGSMNFLRFFGVTTRLFGSEIPSTLTSNPSPLLCESKQTNLPSPSSHQRLSPGATPSLLLSGTTISAVISRKEFN